MALFHQIQGTDIIGTGICIAPSAEPGVILESGRVYASHDDEKAKTFLEKLSGLSDCAICGFIVENSSISGICFESADTTELREGDVVFVCVRGKQVFYQIAAAHTAEESFDSNPRGTHIVRAAQLGEYTVEHGFRKFPWLPGMNTPVFRLGSIALPQMVIQPDEFCVGKIPSVDVSVPISTSELVEYHSAVLGVTGTGKTELVLDLIRQAVLRGTKVFCVDFTGEYKKRLGDLRPLVLGIDQTRVTDFERKIFDSETGQYNAGNEKRALKQFIDEVSDVVAESVSLFLEDGSQNIALLELSEIASSKATLRVTELFLSQIMEWARRNRKLRRVLIVLEEAHTIIPETFGSGFDPNTQFVVSRIGQIALQGRKYGVGLMIVSQRTALVSKTILSQCNTFFVHSLIDQSSLGFLENVLDHETVRLIPRLRFLEFVAYGKAVRIERPVVMVRAYDPAKKQASSDLDVEASSQPHPQPPPSVE